LKDRAVSILFCLLFAVPFGGVGLGAAYLMATMAYDGARARDWVLVKATVSETTPTYHYTFDGQRHSSDRRGTLRIEGTSNVDDFDDRVASIIERGRQEKRPITVWVNPDNPAEAMIDRDIRWMMMVFMVPFALAFGGVGVGALWVAAKVVREPARRKAHRAPPPAAAAMQAAGSGTGGLWIMAVFWNAIAFPAAALAVPQAIASGDWLVLIVLIFPLIGVGLLWGAIAATFGRLRRGKVEIQLSTPTPRVGGPVEGYVTFAKGVKGGESFHVRLVCERTFRSGGGDASVAPHWTRSVTVKAASAVSGMRVPFRLETPANVPASDSGDDDEKPVTYSWRIEVEPAAQRMAVPYRHDIVMHKPVLDTPRTATVEPPARLDAGLEQVLGRFNPSGLTLEQRRAFAQLTTEQQQKLGKVIAFLPPGRKIVIAIVCIWVAVEVVPMIYSLVR